MKFTLLYEKRPKGYMWSRVRLTKIQATTRPDYLWLEAWSSMSKAAHKKEKQEWAIEKTKLDNARRLRGIYFTDPEDGEYKESFKNARKSWRYRWRRLCHVQRETKKRSQKSREIDDETRGSNNIPKKTKHACIVETHESTKKAFGIYTT